MRILLIEDDSEYAYLLKRMLSLESPDEFDITNSWQLSDAIKLLSSTTFDVILLDLSLPDSEGIDTFLKVSSYASNTPIVVLTGMESEALALKAVQAGAEDYLVKTQVNNKTLQRSLRFAVERQQARQALQRMTMIDDLTGLYNRRGFTTLAEKYLQLAQRNKNIVLLLFADMDGLKHINDRYGHQEGDRALQEAARLLRRTYRECDIVARISGDEFVVLAIDMAPQNRQAMSSRLIENLAAYNQSSSLPYPLSISFGIVYNDPASPKNLEQLLASADAAMYEQKRTKHTA